MGLIAQPGRGSPQLLQGVIAQEVETQYPTAGATINDLNLGYGTAVTFIGNGTTTINGIVSGSIDGRVLTIIAGPNVNLVFAANAAGSAAANRFAVPAFLAPGQSATFQWNAGNGLWAPDGYPFPDIPQNLQNGNYTFALSDRGGQVYCNSGTNTYTIPANSGGAAAVPFPIGTVITIANRSGNPLSIQITTDTLVQVGAGATGTRTLATAGLATINKVESTVWMINGATLT